MANRDSRIFQRLDKEQPGQQPKQGHQNAYRPRHIAKEAGHAHAIAFCNGAHHEVGRVTNVTVCAHEHCTRRYGGQGGGHIVHKVLRVTSSRVEKHKVGRRIIQKAGENARQPEIHGIDGLPIVRNKVNQRGKRTISTGAQNGNGGDHADKNAKEQLGNFFNGCPGKAIEFTAAPARKLERKPGKAQQRRIAQKVLPFNRHAEY